MRVESTVTAVRRPHAGILIAAVAAASMLALGACAHGGTVREASAGEVALAPVAPQRAPTFAPITLAELAPAGPAARTTALTRDARPLVAPAFAPRAAARAVELWQGTYVGRTYGQRGALALALGPSANGVGGTVAWRVAGAHDAFGRAGDDAVTLVRVPVVDATRDGDQLVLRLDSFFDPACNCTARATFRGTVRGDTLTGRFTVEGAATLVGEERGLWRAVRAAP